MLWTRYSGQSDIAVGAPIAGRRWKENGSLIGCFVNTLVLRSEVKRGGSVRELLGQVRERTLEAYEHQEVPFEKLVEELQPERDLSRTPLFQVMFGLQNMGSGGEAFSELKVSPFTSGVKLAKFELSMDLVESENGIAGQLVYPAALFESRPAEMAAHFLKVLEMMTANGDMKIEDALLLSEAERRQVLEEWNETALKYPLLTIHELFEAQVRRTPDAVAVA